MDDELTARNKAHNNRATLVEVKYKITQHAVTNARISMHEIYIIE